MSNPKNFDLDYKKYDVSNFYFGAGDDIFELVEAFNIWYEKALTFGYELFSVPLSSSPTSKISIKYGDSELKELINLSSYNYLGLATDKRVIDVATEALNKYGFGASGSPILSGSFDIHSDFSKKIAAFKKKDWLLYFSNRLFS